MGEEEECLKKPESLDLPSNCDLPFLTYGLFKPGQLAFSQIKNRCKKRKIPVYIEGTLQHVNGMPVLLKKYDEDLDFPVKGYIIEFIKDRGTSAYKTICNSKDMHIYSWDTVEHNGEEVNVLVSVDPRKMINLFENPDADVSTLDLYDYNWTHDPVYKNALRFLDSRLDDLGSKIRLYGYDDIEKYSLLFVETQSLYMVLWSALDRFLTFRYSMYQTTNIKQLSEDPIFKKAIENCVDSDFTVTSAQNLKQITVSKNNPKCCAQYYYTLRNNVVHSGKMNVRETRKLFKALLELKSIFKYLLTDVEDEGYEIEAEFYSTIEDELNADKNPIKFKS